MYDPRIPPEAFAGPNLDAGQIAMIRQNQFDFNQEALRQRNIQAAEAAASGALAGLVVEAIVRGIIHLFGRYLRFMDRLARSARSAKPGA